jgi:hypothetical protein
VSPAALLARARDLGIRVAEEGGGLRVEGRSLTDDLVAEIRAAKEEILALLRREVPDAVEAEATEHADAGPPWDKPGPWRWVNPENTPEDLALLWAIERLDHKPAGDTSREKAASSCYCCGIRDWWRSRHGGHLVCRRCHPPAPGAEATPSVGAKECA